MGDLVDWLVDHQMHLGYAVGVLVVLALLQRAARRRRRRRKPAALHPRLEAYAGRTDADLQADRLEAVKIVATSSTAAVAGYQIVQQIEAVYVEGYRTPTDAGMAIKAAAARKGANAIINISQQRTAGGRCTAQGDAVVIEPASAKTP